MGSFEARGPYNESPWSELFYGSLAIFMILKPPVTHSLRVTTILRMFSYVSGVPKLV